MKTLTLFIALAVTSLQTNAQQLLPKDAISLIGKTVRDVGSLMITKHFVITKKDEEFYTYETNAFGESCVVTISYKKEKVSVVSIQQHILYFQTVYSSLFKNEFILIKSFPENNGPLACNGCMSSQIHPTGCPFNSSA